MSYTARAYRDFSKILGDQMAEIAGSVMTEDEVEIAWESINIVTERIADLFEADNPKGFDRQRFMIDAKQVE